MSGRTSAAAAADAPRYRHHTTFHTNFRSTSLSYDLGDSDDSFKFMMIMQRNATKKNEAGRI